jgi:tetratricopeptide (TPR) repeat protein
MDQYENATLFYEKALKINEIDHSNAIIFYQKALQIRQASFPSNHPDIALAYDSIRNMYYDMRLFSDARSYYEKALQIQKISLQYEHPDLSLLICTLVDYIT